MPPDRPPKRRVRKKGGALGLGNVVKTAEKATAAPKRVVRAPRTDIQTSGKAYGVRKATAYRKTAPYKRAEKAAKTSNRQQLAARYTHTGPAKVTFPGKGGGNPIATIVGPVGVAKSLAKGDLAGAVAAANPAAPALKLIKPTGTIAKNAAKDLVNTPATVVPATVHLAGEASKGHVKEVAKELAQPYVHLVKHPKQDITEHPLNSYLLFAGAKGAAGRGAGRVMRATPIPAVKRAASTERAPATLPGTNLKKVRRHSPDVINKAREVTVEKTKIRSSKKAARKAVKARQSGDETTAVRLEEKAAAKNPLLMKPHEIRRRVDETVDANEIIRRQHRAKVVKQVRQAVPKKASAAVSLTAQGITKATKEDLLKYRRELEAEHATLASPSMRRANRLLRQQIGKATRGKHDPARIQKAAEDYAKITRPLQEKLAKAGLYEKPQLERRRLLPYAVRNMGAKSENGRIVAPDGSPLSDAAIKAHMAKRGVKEPAYVTQAPSSRGARNFYVAQHQASHVSRAKFTGTATRKGLFDAHRDTLTETAARSQGLVDAQEGFKRLVGEFGRKEDGKLVTKQTKRQADQLVRDLNTKAGPKWRAIRINPFMGRHEQLKTLVDQVDEAHDHPRVREAIDEAVKGTDGPGPWAIVPEAAADQLRQHVRVLGAGGGGKALQAVNSAFRRTVLATSPRWLTGNVVEAGLRSVVARAGPRSYVTGRKVQKLLDESGHGEQYAARVTGGGHYSMADRMPRRGAEQFHGTRLEPLANGLGAFWRAPGPKQLAAVWRGWTNFVFHDVNSRIERQFQTAMAGAHIRRNLMTDKALKLSDRAIRDAAEGLKETNAQVELGRAVDRMYGQYSKFGPAKRQMVALYTPFVAWTLNAVEFITRVLPRDHPVLTSLLVSASQVTEEWRKEHGLDKFIKDAVPGFLQGTVPTKGGGHIPAARYTPFGLAAAPWQTAGDAVLPQFSGVLAALNGEDWKGKKLTVNGRPADDTEIPLFAAKAFAESTVPALSQAEQLAGGKSVKQVVNPFQPYRSKAKASKKKGGIDWGGAGSSGGKIDWGGSSAKGKIDWGG